MKLTVDLADPSDVAEAYVLLSDMVGTPAQAPAAPTPAAPPAPAPLRGPEPGAQQVRGLWALATRRCPEWR